MSKIKGQNVRVFLNTAVIAKATSCTCTMTGNTEDTKTKDDTSDFAQDTVVTKGWTVSVDSFDDTAIATLLTTMKAKTKVVIKWDEAGGANNASAQLASWWRAGSAYITGITANFDDRNIVSFNVSFQGTGELTDGTETSSASA